MAVSKISKKNIREIRKQADPDPNPRAVRKRPISNIDTAEYLKTSRFGHQLRRLYSLTKGTKARALITQILTGDHTQVATLGKALLTTAKKLRKSDSPDFHFVHDFAHGYNWDTAGERLAADAVAHQMLLSGHHASDVRHLYSDDDQWHKGIARFINHTEDLEDADTSTEHEKTLVRFDGDAAKIHQEHLDAIGRMRSPEKKAEALEAGDVLSRMPNKPTPPPAQFLGRAKGATAKKFGSLTATGVPAASQKDFPHLPAIPTHAVRMSRSPAEIARAYTPNLDATPSKLVPDPVKQAETARVYAGLKHNPKDPLVHLAYSALKQEIKQQYLHLKEHGVVLEPWKGEGQPYRDSNHMREDAAAGHLYYFPTGAEMDPSHPLAEVDPETGLMHNDMFRAVHDYFGHTVHPHQFGPKGEIRAWHEHAKMFSPLARRALTTETHGQNSWVNFGPHSHLPVTERPYAEQKAALLPEEHWPTKLSRGGLPWTPKNSVELLGLIDHGDEGGHWDESSRKRLQEWADGGGEAEMPHVAVNPFTGKWHAWPKAFAGEELSAPSEDGVLMHFTGPKGKAWSQTPVAGRHLVGLLRPKWWHGFDEVEVGSEQEAQEIVNKHIWGHKS